MRQFLCCQRPTLQQRMGRRCEISYPSLMDGLRAQMIAEAAVESLHTNQPIKITYWQPE